MNCLGKLSRGFGPHAGAGPAAHDHRPYLSRQVPGVASRNDPGVLWTNRRGEILNLNHAVSDAPGSLALLELASRAGSIVEVLKF